MAEKLTLNDGTEIDGHLLESGERLFLYMRGITMKEAFDVLIDPENTKSIKWERYSSEGVVKGYKHLYSVTEELNGMITASLMKK